MQEREILHCDCNGFYASVECVLNPKLRNVAMAVGGNERDRHGIILAKNEIAKKYNIKTAETIWQAKKKCPSLVIVSPHHDIYRQYSKKIFEIYKRYTDLVEPFSLDEAWLDVTGSRRLFGDGKTIADELRRVVKEEIGITISVGVSFCKVFAKLGSDYKKPDATTVFSAADWKKYIFPMPAQNMLYVGKSTLKDLNEMGIYTIGDIASYDRELLKKRLGKLGETLHLYANGLDDAPVKSIYDKDEIKSVGKGKTFAKDISGYEELDHEIRMLSEDVARRLRAHGLKCTTVQLHIKDPHFRTISRQIKCRYPTYTAREISEYASALLRRVWNKRSPVRMLTVTGNGLVPEDKIMHQLSLFEEDNTEKQEKSEKLEKTLDMLKNKFGNDMFS